MVQPDVKKCKQTVLYNTPWNTINFLQELVTACFHEGVGEMGLTDSGQWIFHFKQEDFDSKGVPFLAENGEVWVYCHFDLN